MTKLYHQAEGWTVPGKQGAGAERHDVPNSPEQLADWLNARHVPPQPLASAWARDVQLAGEPDASDPLAAARTAAMERAIEEARRRCPKCGDTATTAAAIAESGDLLAITDWIFDRATAAQVEQVFAALGARFHELRKEAGK